jgi:NAD(P)H-dependent flavin oxidoreductase YrpB (nitropropane dioxygenase family)
VVLGGMGTGTASGLVAAVSAAGGLGVLGASHLPPATIDAEVGAIRERTDRPFGLNFLLAFVEEDRFAAALDLRPAVLSFAWPRPEQDLRAYYARAHDAGALVMHMVSTAADARQAAAAGADVVVAQGTEGGGHVGQMGTLVVVPQTVRAVPDVPVLAAGGIADGAGLAAALALGADGVLLGTRFLATPEAPIPPSFKQAILDSDGTDTLLTDIPDIAAERDWPGAMNRVRRNRFIEEWLGREWLLRQRRGEVFARMQAARAADDAEHSSLGIGQDAGLIDRLEPAGSLVERLVAEAEQIIDGRLPPLRAARSAAAR